MPINGLMITLSMDAQKADEALLAILEHDHIDCGIREQRWLPVVTEARDDKHALEMQGWLESLQGVEQVAVIMVSFPEQNLQPS